MEVILGLVVIVALIWFAGFMLFEFPEIMIVLFIVAVLLSMCVGTTSVEVTEEITEVVESLKTESNEPPPPEIQEVCNEGNTYFVFTRDGIEYKTAKEDSHGYNVRCTR